MRNRKRTLGAAIVVLGVLIIVAGCNIGAIPEGYGAVTMKIQGTLTGGSAPSASYLSSRAAGDPLSIPVTGVSGTGIGTLELTEIRASLGEIELEQDDDEINTDEETEQDLEIEYEGPFVVDFINYMVNPVLPRIEMLPGTYDNIKLDLKKIEGDELDADGDPLVEATDPLFGNSVYMEGTYSGETSTGAVVDMPFSLSLAIDEEFELGSGAADTVSVVVEEGQLNPVIIAFRMPVWFAFDNPETNSGLTIDFSDVVPESGTIVLDAGATDDNLTIMEIMKENLEKSADYGEDDDGSGELESDEDDDPDDEDQDDYMDVS